MKKLAFGLAAVLILMLLAGCTAEKKDTGLSLQPVELTQEESSLQSLLGGGGTEIFEFTTKSELKSVRMERYELADGAWKACGGGSFAISGETGRLALTLNTDSGEIRFAMQDEHGTSAVRQDYPDENLTGLGIGTSYLTEKTAIVPGQEIPLAIQTMTREGETVSYSVEYFSHPEEYEKMGCEHVYALTVTFFDEPLS